MSRGSGLDRAGGHEPVRARAGGDAVRLVRPLLDIPKARLIATLRAAKSLRRRSLQPRSALHPRAAARPDAGARARRTRCPPAGAAGAAAQAGRPRDRSRRRSRRAGGWQPPADRARARAFDAAGFARLPAEIALRLLGRAVAKAGDEGPVELGKLEALKAALEAAQNSGNARFRRSLAGALVTLGGGTNCGGKGAAAARQNA